MGGFRRGVACAISIVALLPMCATAARADAAATVAGFGDAGSYGSTGAKQLAQPIVGIAATPSDRGYWLVASDGGIFRFGDAAFYGSMGGRPLNRPVVGMAATPSGRGYWLVASDGGIFRFGDAAFYGSMGGRPLNGPVVGMAATHSGRGYWIVASDGGIFRLGDARFYGSTGSLYLRAPIAGMASSASSRGYWMVASDGGIFSFGDARSYGNAVDRGLVGKAVVAMAPTASGRGYWIASAGKLAIRPVYVVGDSLTVGAAPYIPGAFAASGIPLVAVDGKVGRHTSEGAAVLAGAIANGAVGPNTTIVAALGTNDYGSASNFAQQVDQFLAVAGGRRVVWVNIAFADGRDAQAVALNAQLDVRASRLRVADWHSFIAGHGDWWAGDGTHLNATGYEGRATWLAGEIVAAS